MPKLGWRWLLGLSVLPSFILLIFYIITPESPRYLILKGRKKEALQVLEKISKINGKNLPPGTLITDIELQEKTTNISTKNQDQNQDLEVPPKWKDSEMTVWKSVMLLLSPKLAKTTLLLWVVFFGNAFAYYGLVLLTTQLNNKDNVCGKTEPDVKKLDNSKPDIDYKDVFITSFAGNVLILHCLSLLRFLLICQGGWSSGFLV